MLNLSVTNSRRNVNHFHSPSAESIGRCGRPSAAALRALDRASGCGSGPLALLLSLPLVDALAGGGRRSGVVEALGVFLVIGVRDRGRELLLGRSHGGRERRVTLGLVRFGRFHGALA